MRLRLVLIAALLMGFALAPETKPTKKIGNAVVRESKAHGGRFVEAESGGQKLGFVELPNGRIQMVRNGKKAEVVPVEAPAEAAPLMAADVPTTRASNPPSTSSIFSVLVFYTPSALAGAGGNIDNEIALATARMNDAFANSKINAQTEVLATIVLSDWVESKDSGTELTNFRLHPMLQPALNLYGADCAMLMVQSMDYAGRAFYGPNKSSCVGVTMRQYATGNLTYAHEFGHTLGLGHNVGEYSYCGNGVGYEDPQKRFRTPMSYGTGPRTPQFSAPPPVLHYLLGLPVGTAETDSTGCLKRTIPIASAFRTTNPNTPPAAPSNATADNVR